MLEIANYEEKKRKSHMTNDFTNRATYKYLHSKHLILFAISSIIANNEICTFERLVAECFNRFPKVFSFKRYPQWPDSMKLDRQLRTLREEGLIIGTARDHFELTEAGKLIATEIKTNLTSARKRGQIKTSPTVRSAEDRIIEFLKTNKLFHNYCENPQNFRITETQTRNLLRCTLETPRRVVKQNLEYYLKLVEKYNELELKKFLMKCKDVVMGASDG